MNVVPTRFTHPMVSPADEALARFAERHHGVFALRHLDELAFSREARAVRVEAGRWDAIHEGVFRLAGSPIDRRGDLLAACWAGGTRALASHRSAAALLALPSGVTKTLELTCPRWRRARHDGLIVHESKQLDEVDRLDVAGIPCTSPARTLFDLARCVSARMLDADIDTAIRNGLVSLSELKDAADRLAKRGRPGSRRFSAAVADRDPAQALPESVPERLLSDMLVRQGLRRPVVQHEVRDATGRFIARVDLAYPELMLAIEYDSFEHHTGKLALVRDSARRNALTEIGITVLTATAEDLRDDGAGLAASIRRVRDRAA